MSDNKTYYYMRLKENFFETDSMMLLEGMPDGIIYSNILLKMYLRSLKCNGKLLLNEYIPYNAQMIATITRQQVGTVEKALTIFEQLGLIDVLDNGTIYMSDIELMVGKTSTEGDRKKRARLENKKKQLGQMSDKCPPEIEIESEIESEIELKENTKRKSTIPYQQIADMYNDTCVSLPSVKSLSDKRKKAIKARLNTYTIDDFKNVFEKTERSDFLTGRTGQWSATFDWLLNENNMIKVLEGNYDNKQSKAKESDKAAEEKKKDDEEAEFRKLQMQKAKELAAKGMSRWK